MTKKLNWKAKAVEMYHMNIAKAESYRENKDKSSTAMAFLCIGAAQSMQDLLLDYGVDVEEESA